MNRDQRKSVEITMTMPGRYIGRARRGFQNVTPEGGGSKSPT